MSVPFVEYVARNSSEELDPTTFPGSLPFVRNLHCVFETPVTFFVGENGTGKSTLMEAMAVLSRLPICGGSTNEFGRNHAFPERSILAESIQLAFKRQPQDRYFFRAENAAYFASLLDERDVDPHFLESNGAKADPYKRYGGSSLHNQSHGEAFLSLMSNRFESGLLLLDEPESALSPNRQLQLLALINEMVEAGGTQVFIATHSPILLTLPNSTIFSFDHEALTPITIEETAHFDITRRMLNHPEQFWNRVRDNAKPGRDEG